MHIKKQIRTVAALLGAVKKLDKLSQNANDIENGENLLGYLKLSIEIDEPSEAEKLLEKHYFVKTDGSGINGEAFSKEMIEESFQIFKSLYNLTYGSIEEDGNLISIHTGGWSDNEELIRIFKKTVFWQIHIDTQSTGGNYFFVKSSSNPERWIITTNSKSNMTEEQTNPVFNRITANGCREMDEVRFNQAVNEIISSK